MPKIVDHDERREQVMAATLALVARSGLEGATMRAIADEAGCSTGLVTHYFANRRELIVGVLRHVHAQSAVRMSRHLAGSSAADALEAVVLEGLPLDDERRLEWQVWLAFWGAAVGDPTLADEHRHRYREWRGAVRTLVAGARDEGALRADLDVQAETDRLVALIDGLGLEATLEPDRLKPRRIRTLVREHLAALR